MTVELALKRMPHRGAMQLIETIRHADESSITCLAKTHSAPDYPLRVEGVLHSSALVELGAQAAAAHASLFGIGAAHAGLLLTLSNVEIGYTQPDQVAEPLQVWAERLHGDAGSARYRFRVMHGEAEMMLSGDAVLSMRAST